MRITQIHSVTRPGGAANVMMDLHRGLGARGHEMSIWTGVNDGNIPEAKVFDQTPFGSLGKSGVQVASLLRILMKKSGLRSHPAIREWGNRTEAALGNPRRIWDEWRGYESFAYSGIRRWLNGLKDRPDVVQLHNLHGNYFDLGILPELSIRMPTVVTLHDAWMLAGHCAHSFDCERWKSGCGCCPDLTISPRIRRDATARNWRVKKNIYAKCRLGIITPSRWLMGKVNQSILNAGVAQAAVIPNGVDCEVYRPADRREARRRLGIPEGQVVFLTLADPGYRNRWKDFRTTEMALRNLAAESQSKATIVGIGCAGSPETVRNWEFIWVPKVGDRLILADYYRAADVYIHAAHAENFPNMILESMACGCCVVASAIGGIPEQIDQGKTGVLVPPHDPAALADALAGLMDSGTACGRIGCAASETVLSHFGLEKQAAAYESFYAAFISKHADYLHI